MKLSIFFYFSVVATSILAAPKPNSQSGYLQLAVNNRHGAKNPRKMRRDDQQEEHELDNDVYQYTADLKIGTPGQNVEVLIDTGSSDLWVFTNHAADKNVYSPNDSSTYEFVSNGFEIQYVSGAAEGEWVKDTIQMGDITVKEQQFGAVEKSDSSSDIGIFGIGPTANEVRNAPGGQYPNFPQSLVDQKIIKKNAYSLYLDDLEASSGSILFGGVDSSKYKGKLYTVSFSDYAALAVSASVNGSETFDASLDCGTSLTYIPSKIVEKYAKEFGAQFDSQSGLYFVDDVIDGSLEFDISGIKISVPGDELAVKADKYSVTNAPKPYVFTLLPNDQTQGMNLLGDSFLRSAYAVFDLEDKQVALAQASYDTDNSDIKVIEDEIPGAEKAPGGSRSTKTSSDSNESGIPGFFNGLRNRFSDIFHPKFSG